MLLLNLGLATFGLIGSLAAFGGETWKQGSAPILSRVTRRGWIALGCLLLAFALGGLKEVLHYQAGKLDALEKASLQKRNEDQIAQIATLQKSLETTTQRLGEQQLGSIEAAFKLAIGRVTILQCSFIGEIVSLSPLSMIRIRFPSRTSPRSG